MLGAARSRAIEEASPARIAFVTPTHRYPIGVTMSLQRRMHLLARLPRRIDDVTLVARLNEAGMAPSSLSACGVALRYAPALVIGFTNVEAKKAVQAARARCRFGWPIRS